MKIIVRGANWIGDGVITIPALRKLRRIFPDAEITLHTRSWAKGIFEDADFIDEILTFEQAETSLNDVIAQSRILRKMQFDLAVIFPNSFASALTARFAGIPKRFGYSKDARRIFLTNPVKVPEWKNERHEVFYYLNLVTNVEKSILGTETDADTEPNPEIRVSDSRKSAARGFLSESGVDAARPIIALGVGSTNSRAKRWGVENYAALNDRLQNELSASVILVGGMDDVAVANEVRTISKLEPFMLAGKTDLPMSTAILSVADLLVSNDMGLAHIAPSVGTKTIVIFGPTNPVTTRPF